MPHCFSVQLRQTFTHQETKLHFFIFKEDYEAYLLTGAFAWIKRILPIHFFFLHLKPVLNHSIYAQRIVLFLLQNHVRRVSGDQEKADLLNYKRPHSSLKITHAHIHTHIYIYTYTCIYFLTLKIPKYFVTHFIIIYLNRQTFLCRKIGLFGTSKTF